MTTAHRPTYVSSKGGNIQGGSKLYYPSLLYSAKDLPSNLNVKIRHPGQGTIGDVRHKDFKKELLEREKRSSLGLLSQSYADMEDEMSNSLMSSRIDLTSDLLQLEAPKKKQRLDSISGISEIHAQVSNSVENVFVQDKDLEFSEDDEEKSKSDINNSNNEDNQNSEENLSNSEEDEEDEEEELLYREYEKILKMRKEEMERKEAIQAENEKIQTQEHILTGNPILNSTSSSYSLKKKWFEDTVFKNQTKNEPKIKKRFINDTVRSDFHRKFIAKTIQ